MKYIVQIKQYEDDKVIKEFGPYDAMWSAEKVCDRIEINMNIDGFYTDIVEKPQNPKTPGL